MKELQEFVKWIQNVATVEARTKKIKDDPCWKGYEMVGTKKKNGKEVPNCVPKESAVKETVHKDKSK